MSNRELFGLAETGDRESYIGALRWRRQNLIGELASIEAEKSEIAKREARVVNQLRSIGALLAAELDAADPASSSSGSTRTDSALEPLTKSVVEVDAHLPGQDQPLGFAVSSEIGALIYAAIDATLREAGVPLHYRQLADQIRDKVPLRGRDPAATLLAYLSKATDRFSRVGRGIYWLASEPQPAIESHAEPESSMRRRRRRRRSR